MNISAAPEDRGSLLAFARRPFCCRRSPGERRAFVRLYRLLGPALALGGVSVAAASSNMSAAAPPTAILEPWAGGAAPAFVLDALDGGPARLASHRGDAVLVHFFATWCETCRTELPALERLAARRARTLAVLAISVGEVEPAVRRFLGAEQRAFRVLLDRDRAVAKAWDIYALPTTVILDETLAPQLIAVGDVDWDDPAIDRLLDQTSPSHPAPEGRPPHLSRSRLLRPSAAQTGRTP